MLHFHPPTHSDASHPRELLPIMNVRHRTALIPLLYTNTSKATCEHNIPMHLSLTVYKLLHSAQIKNYHLAQNKSKANYPGNCIAGGLLYSHTFTERVPLTICMYKYLHAE